MSTTKKIGSTIADIAAKITANRAEVERLQAEAAELDQQQRWVAGEERRARLAEIRTEAETHLGGASEAAEIAARARDLAEAARQLHAAGRRRNDRLTALRARALAEGVKAHGGNGLPPSPADNGLGLLDHGLVLGRWRCRPVDATRLAVRALDAGADSAVTGAEVPTFEDDVAAFDDEMPALSSGLRYYRHTGHGGTFSFAAPPAVMDSLVEITQVKWLAHQWGVDLDELPEDVRPTEEGVTAP